MQKFIENGFDYSSLESEINELAQQTGKSPAEIKLAALEMKEAVTKAHNLVGGSEEYNAMLAWAKDNLSEAQRSDFDKSILNGMGEFAIKGLYAEFNAKRGSQETKQRIQGDAGSGNGAVKAYSTFAELARDRAYLQSPQGRNDKGARELHARRLNITPDSIIYGR